MSKTGAALGIGLGVGCGEVTEVANVAQFLASDESSYVTEECIYVDGGRLGLNYTVPVDG